MAGKTFYRERHKVGTEEKKPRFKMVADADVDLTVYANHLLIGVLDGSSTKFLRVNRHYNIYVYQKKQSKSPDSFQLKYHFRYCMNLLFIYYGTHRLTFKCLCYSSLF